MPCRTGISSFSLVSRHAALDLDRPGCGPCARPDRVFTLGEGHGTPARRRREVFPTARQGGTGLRAPRQRGAGRPSCRPARQGRGAAFHLRELPGHMPAPRRPDRRDPGDGQPDADEGPGPVHQHHDRPRAGHARGAARLWARPQSRSAELGVPQDPGPVSPRTLPAGSSKRSATSSSRPRMAIRCTASSPT